MLSIIDNEGRTVKSVELNGSFSKEINLSELEDGIYYYQLVESTQQITGKITIQKWLTNNY